MVVAVRVSLGVKDLVRDSVGTNVGEGVDVNETDSVAVQEVGMVAPEEQQGQTFAR